MSRTLRNVFTVGAFTALSRVFGLVREMLQSRCIGAGIVQSAFTLAFAIPNMARKLFGEGALTAAFVPVFKSAVESESLERAGRLARAVMTMVVLMLGAIVLLVMGGLELVVTFRRALGIRDMERFMLTIRLVKAMLPYMIFICGAAFGMGVLNALGKFKASSFMPCLLNVCWIAMLGWISFHPDLRLDQRIHRVAMAILAAGALQLAFMAWCMHRTGVSPRFTFSGWTDPKVRLVWRNIGIAALGAGAIQINYLLDQILAQLAAPWAAGVIGYAERLMDLPLGIIGVAFGTVLLPTFAGLFARRDEAGAREALTSSVTSLLFIMIPAGVGLVVLAQEVTGVIYQGGEFDGLATRRVARALATYSLGMGFFGFNKVLVPWFQAQNDMKTPLRVTLSAVGVNAALNVLAVLLLPEEWRHVGLAASTVACSAFSCGLLVRKARQRNGTLGLAHCLNPLCRVLVASAVMAGALLMLRPLAADWCAGLGDRVGPVVALAALIAAGAFAYGGCALLLMREQLRTLRRRKRRG